MTTEHRQLQSYSHSNQRLNAFTGFFLDLFNSRDVGAVRREGFFQVLGDGFNALQRLGLALNDRLIFFLQTEKMVDLPPQGP